MSGEELGPQGGDAVASPGEVLAAAREAVGVTHREVAEALNLPIRTVEAIENDDPAHLPAQVFTRGYIRAYAKLLEIDPEPLLAAIDPGEQEPVQATSAQTGSGSVFSLGSDPIAVVSPKPRISLQYLMYAGASLAVIIIWAVVFFSLGGADEPVDNPQPPTQDVSSEAAKIGAPTIGVGDGAPTIGAPLLRGDESRVVQSDQDLPNSENAEVALPVVASQVDDSVQVPVPETQESSIAPVALADESGPASQVFDGPRRLTGSGDDRLTLSFSQDCWLEISEPDGIELFADLGRAGQTLSFIGGGPFRVKLGYAPGVEMEYNAEVVALAAHTRRDMANLVVGREPGVR
jgi:cytoskeleton protein RodZ